MRVLNIDEQAIVNGGVFERPYFDKACVTWFLGYYTAIFGTWAAMCLIAPATENGATFNLMSQGNQCNAVENAFTQMCSAVL